jgi:hypothetical protein
MMTRRGKLSTQIYRLAANACDASTVPVVRASGASRSLDKSTKQVPAKLRTPRGRSTPRASPIREGCGAGNALRDGPRSPAAAHSREPRRYLTRTADVTPQYFADSKLAKGEGDTP